MQVPPGLWAADIEGDGPVKPDAPSDPAQPPEISDPAAEGAREDPCAAASSAPRAGAGVCLPWEMDVSPWSLATAEDTDREERMIEAFADASEGYLRCAIGCEGMLLVFCVYVSHPSLCLYMAARL